jgi:hypothetical protein
VKKIKLTFALLILCACSSKGTKTPSVSTSKVETPKANVCDSEPYKGNADYNEVSEKEYVNDLKNGDRVYLKNEVKKCEEYFDEGVGLECGIQRTVSLVWESNSKTVDSAGFLESGCEHPNSPFLKTEPWAPNDVKVKKDIATVEHYWNYYERNADEDEKCLLRRFNMDRSKKKLIELSEGKCK